MTSLSNFTIKKFVFKFKSLLFLNLGLALFIILWGAWVRLSGSGAGCGEHWPLCHGEIVPLSPTIQTLIEFTHRLTSGLFGITVLAQLVISIKDYGKYHPLTKSSFMLLVLTIVEALIGAVLVKKGLVAKNSSNLRAWVIGLHLVNTLFLLASLVFSIRFLNLKNQLKRRDFSKEQQFLAYGALFLFLIVSAFGAITALGNTLFPSSDILSGIKSDFDSNAPFLIRLRIYHPTLAVLTSLLWLYLLYSWKDKVLESSKLWNMGINLIFAGIGFGFLNWLLMAPHWGSLLHLLLADLTWMILVSCFIERKYII